MEVMLDGRKYELPDTGSLDFAEWRLLKQRTGMTAPEFEVAMRGIDQEAWLWLCVIAIKRDEPDRPIEEIEADMLSVNFLGMFQETEEEEGRPSPEPIAEAKSSEATTPDADGRSLTPLSSG